MLVDVGCFQMVLMMFSVVLGCVWGMRPLVGLLVRSAH